MLAWAANRGNAMQLQSEAQKKFEKCIEHFRHELSGIRTGRASVAMLENVVVESYGVRMPISHLASVAVTDPKTIVIQPWDKSNFAAIEKGIQAANIGLNPVNDGNAIRLNFPPMTEERRKELVKAVGHMAENARIALRNAREEILKELKKGEEDKQMGKDAVEAEKKKLQELVDSYNEQIKRLAFGKEKEIATI